MTETMTKKILLPILILILAGFACLTGSGNGTPAPKPDSGQARPGGEERFAGVTYTKDTRTSPRPMAIHVVAVDLRADGIGILVTPGDADRDLPLDARTTSEFLAEFGVQIAVNGDGFTPWHSYTPLDYYPHSGDPVDVLGFAASNGVVYSQPRDNVPTLYFGRSKNKAVFNRPPGKINHAISGLEMIVKKGKAVNGLGDNPQPRTAIGLNRGGKKLIIVVVDGRQSGYSEGATLAELAAIMLEYGAHEAMNMDGGGSSTLAMAGTDAIVLNSPIEHYIPGRERPVGNHLGIFAKGK